MVPEHPNSSKGISQTGGIDGSKQQHNDTAYFCYAGMRRLNEEDEENIHLKQRFYSLIEPEEHYRYNVVAIHRNMHATATGRARCGAFKLHLKAMAEKRGGNPNVRAGWFGASRDEVRRIMDDGFGIYGMPQDSELGGFGVHIFSELSANSALPTSADEDGLRHLVYCQMILGNVEEVLPSSRQSHPSSESFDSGVDNLIHPRKYIVWYPDVKTHILPLYVLSIKIESPAGMLKEPKKKPSSPWISFRALLSILSDSLPPSTMSLIKKLHCDFMERKITRQQMIHRVRQLTGDKLLISAITSFQKKRSAQVFSGRAKSSSPTMCVTDITNVIDFM